MKMIIIFVGRYLMSLHLHLDLHLHVYYNICNSIISDIILFHHIDNILT